MEDKRIGFRTENGLATITLDDRENANALSENIIEDLVPALDKCAFDDDIRAVLLIGANDTFCSGGNIKSLKVQADEKSASRLTLGRLGDIATRLMHMSKPTVCAIRGACAGAGTSLAMACDFSIAAEDAKFCFAFINLALVSDMGGTAFLVKTAGVNKAKELLLGGSVFSGVQAAEWGIVTKAVPADALDGETEKLCAKLLATAPAAYARNKRMINDCAYAGFDRSLQAEMEYQFASFHSQDHLEGVNAFLEKRRPHFDNK